MAHFAELDSNNRVLRVVTADQTDINNNGGDQSEQAATNFEKTVPLSELGVKWMQTSKTNSFRKKYAAVGDIYDSEKDKFLNPQPYSSWTLDANDDWQPPVAKPVTYTQVYASQEKSFPDIYNWNEDTDSWELVSDGTNP